MLSRYACISFIAKVLSVYFHFFPHPQSQITSNTTVQPATVEVGLLLDHDYDNGWLNTPQLFIFSKKWSFVFSIKYQSKEHTKLHQKGLNLFSSKKWSDGFSKK